MLNVPPRAHVGLVQFKQVGLLALLGSSGPACYPLARVVSYAFSTAMVRTLGEGYVMLY